jgi:hypothetical protein
VTDTTTPAVAVEDDEIVLEAGRYDEMPLAWLIPARRNANRGRIGDIVEALKEFGQHKALVVQRSTREIIVGNHTYQAMRTLGWNHAWVVVVDDDDEKALRRALTDNATGRNAEWDKEELADQLQKVGSVPGITDDQVAELLGKLEAKAAPPDQPVFPITPRFNESYDYVVVVAENEMDAAWLRTRFMLRKEANYKNSGVGTSHVVTVERAREVIDGEAPENEE